MPSRRRFQPRLDARLGDRAGLIVSMKAYFRAAQAYMLISMPTGTSTILGVFQVIPSSHDVWRELHAEREPRTMTNVAQVRASGASPPIFPSQARPFRSRAKCSDDFRNRWSAAHTLRSSRQQRRGNPDGLIDAGEPR
jgi:hypothetical protein